MTEGLGLALPAALAFVGAAVLALLLTPLARRLAHRFDALDHPDARRVNTQPVARGGGLAVAAAFLIVASVIMVADAAAGLWIPTDRLKASDVVAVLGGGALAALLGLFDDWLDLRARWQMLGQVALAAIALALGIGVAGIANPFGPGQIRLDGVFGIAFTLFWIVGMMNAINFIDGLDGLSSGIGLIAAATLGIISLTATIDQPAVGVLCFVLAGALLGFLRWNWHPASIFAGTSGVMFLGFTLAVLSMLGTAKVAVALLVLGVPIIDTFYNIVRRVASGRSPFSPDRGHIHHRLLDVGLSQTRTVLVIYAICIGFALLSLVLTGTGQMYAFVGAVVVFGVVAYVLNRLATAGPPETGPNGGDALEQTGGNGRVHAAGGEVAAEPPIAAPGAPIAAPGAPIAAPGRGVAQPGHGVPPPGPASDRRSASDRGPAETEHVR